jgi:CHAT domain-containing protein
MEESIPSTLDADLVVLSACESGLGRELSGTARTWAAGGEGAGGLDSLAQEGGVQAASSRRAEKVGGNPWSQHIAD